MIELFSAGSLNREEAPPRRNLGSAILLAAIEDYRCLDRDAHRCAARFLYPQTEEWRQHYDWVISLAEGLNPVWLRDALDKTRKQWDEERSAQMRRRLVR